MPLAARCAGCCTELPPAAKFCLECGAKVGMHRPPAPVVPDRRPGPLADNIRQAKPAIEGERKQVTVLFADVKGSMELAERFEGFVDKFIGDGVMALFGALIAHEDHAQRACHAALHRHDALKTYADELRRTHGVSLSTRIGINSGEVVVGRIGDDLRMDYRAQGHTVGLAQRIAGHRLAAHVARRLPLARLLEVRRPRAASRRSRGARAWGVGLRRRSGADRAHRCAPPAPWLSEWRAELAAVLGDDAARVRLLRAAQPGYLEIGAPQQAERIGQGLQVGLS